MPARRSSQSGSGKDEPTTFSAIQQNFILYLYLHDIVGDDAGKELNRYLAPHGFKTFRNGLEPMQQEIQGRIAEIKAFNVTQVEATIAATTLKQQSLTHSWGSYLKRAIGIRDKDLKTKKADARERRADHELQWSGLFNAASTAPPVIVPTPPPVGLPIADSPYPGELTQRAMSDKLMSLAQ